jgi:hypothetical protein
MRAFSNQYTGTAAGNLFRQGAVHINGERITDVAQELEVTGSDPLIIKVGRKYVKVVAE